MSPTTMLSAVSFALVIGVIQHTSAEHWSYKNTDKWEGICGKGTQQSPIDLSVSKAAEVTYDPFVFSNYFSQNPLVIKNNGHSVTATFKDLNSTVKGGGLEEEYRFHHYHFHWDSEHTIEGRRLPLEVHLVHHATRHGNIEEALRHKNGLAVLGTLFDLSPDDDEEINSVLEDMRHVAKKTKSEVVANNLSPGSFLPRDRAGFYRYEGSLTTPGCNEGVLWTVFTNTLPVSIKQANEFKTIMSEEGPLIKNFRPVQSLNKRRLFLKRSPYNSAHFIASSYIMITLTIILSMISF